MTSPSDALLCDAEDVAEWLGRDRPYEGAELLQVDRLCLQVSGLIRARRPLIDVWTTTGRIDPVVVRGVACHVVGRIKTALAMGGVAAQAESQSQFALSAATSALALTADELASLTPSVTSSLDEQGAFTIRPGGSGVRCEHR